MANNFKKGDLVNVIDDGEQYNTYKVTFMKLCLNNYRYNECIRESGPFVVLSTVDECVGIRSLESGIEYCFRYKGLKLVNENKNFNAFKDFLINGEPVLDFAIETVIKRLYYKNPKQDSLKFILNLKR